MSDAMAPVGSEVVVPCDELIATMSFFMKRLGFRLEVIFPADRPRVAVVAGHGVRLRLEEGAPGTVARIRLLVAGPVDPADRELVAPNGTVVEFVAADPEPVVPPVRQSLVISRMADSVSWGTGRAGMQYRDLIPDRQGGRFIASHIRIAEPGPVPDYVHFHKIRFQMIFCRRGWVKVVYEDQGEPFVMHAGDCVLQPPEIRHRVLESSGPLEVIEIGCPAEHETRPEHGFDLPTPTIDADRDFGGQRFVRHVAAQTPWRAWRPGFEARDTGIGAATSGLAGARVLRPAAGEASTTEFRSENEFHFWFVLTGAATIVLDGVAHRFGEADSVVMPTGTTVGLCEASADLELLEVTLPAVLAGMSS